MGIDTLVVEEEKVIEGLPDLIFDKKLKQTDPFSVYFMDQIFFDSIMFNEQAWENGLSFLQQIHPTGLILSGALIRTDRPEYKIEDLTYWHDSEDLLRLSALYQDQELSLQDLLKIEKKHGKSGKRYAELRARLGADTLYDAVEGLMRQEFELVSSRFEQLRHMLPETQIAYAWSQDDGFSANRLTHYFDLAYKQGLKHKLSDLRSERNQFWSEEKDLVKKRKKAKGKEKKKINNDLTNIRKKIERRNRQIGESEDEQDLFRSRKESPVHQIFAKKGYDALADRYKQILGDSGIHFIPRQAFTQVGFGETKLLYKSQARSQDAPILNRAKQLNATLGDKVTEMLAKQIRLYAEGGQGTFWYGRFDTSPSVEEINTGMQKTWQPSLSSYQDSIHAALIPVFHDQSVIADIQRGDDEKMLHRFGGRTASGTRKHYAVTMFENGGVSGLFGFVRDDEGRIGREVVSYGKLLRTANVPTKWYVVEMQSDAHRGIPNTAYEIQTGDKLRRERNLARTPDFRGLPAQYVALFSGGDDIEGNTSGWKGAGAEYQRRTMEEILDEVKEFGSLTSMDSTHAFQFLNYVMGVAREGNFENMDDLLRWVDHHYTPEIARLAETSPLLTVFAATDGNHFFGTSRPTGIGTFSKLQTRIDEKGISDRIQIDMRPARSLSTLIDSFGQTIDGMKYFNPFSIFLEHDPPVQKQDLFYWTAREAQRFGADVGIAGHYHVSGQSAIRRNDKPNSMVHGINLPALQRVLSTDFKKDGKTRNKGTASLYIAGYEIGIDESLATVDGGKGLEHILVFENEPKHLIGYAINNLYELATGKPLKDSLVRQYLQN